MPVVVCDEADSNAPLEIEPANVTGMCTYGLGMGVPTVFEVGQ